MATFGWFGDQEHRVFNYKPRYYDPEAEERKRMFGAVDSPQSKDGEGKDSTYTPGNIIQGSLRGGNYSRHRGPGKAQTIIGIVSLILVAVILIYIAKFYSLL